MAINMIDLQFKSFDDPNHEKPHRRTEKVHAARMAIYGTRYPLERQ